MSHALLCADFKPDVYLPYAKWLLSKDQFGKARVAYCDGGRPDLGRALLETLADNAMTENRFADASYAYYQLAIEALKVNA